MVVQEVVRAVARGEEGVAEASPAATNQNPEGSPISTLPSNATCMGTSVVPGGSVERAMADTTNGAATANAQKTSMFGVGILIACTSRSER